MIAASVVAMFHRTDYPEKAPKLAGKELEALRLKPVKYVRSRKIGRREPDVSGRYQDIQKKVAVATANNVFFLSSISRCLKKVSQAILARIGRHDEDKQEQIRSSGGRERKAVVINRTITAKGGRERKTGVINRKITAKGGRERKKGVINRTVTAKGGRERKKGVIQRIQFDAAVINRINDLYVT